MANAPPKSLAALPGPPWGRGFSRINRSGRERKGRREGEKVCYEVGRVIKAGKTQKLIDRPQAGVPCPHCTLV